MTQPQSAADASRKTLVVIIVIVLAVCSPCILCGTLSLLGGSANGIAGLFR